MEPKIVDTKTMSARYEISLRPMLRYFGLLVPTVIGLPHIIALLGLGYAAVFASESDASGLKVVSWLGILMSCLFASLGGWFAWRWWRLGAYLDAKEVGMRGLLRSVRIPVAKIHDVRLESIPTYSFEQGHSRKSRHVFVDQEGKTLASLPASVSICKDFQLFLSRLERVASQNKRSTARLDTRDLSNLPIEDWTSQDIEDYEKNS